jgi:hypothetical protein
VPQTRHQPRHPVPLDWRSMHSLSLPKVSFFA